jgi:hypothetical protein
MISPRPTPSASGGGSRRRSPAVATILPWVLRLAFLVDAGWWLVRTRQGLLPANDWYGALLAVLAGAATLAGLARGRPFESALLAAAVVATWCGVIQIVAAKTGLPLALIGNLRIPGLPADRAFSLWPPLLSAFIVLNSRGAARLVLRSWGNVPAPGFWTIGLACLLAEATGFNFNPAGFHGLQGWGWVAGSTLTTLVILVFTTPWLISKKPGTQCVRDTGPFVLWLGLNLLLAAARFL